MATNPNPLAIVNHWFENEFAQNCTYAWPYSLEAAEYILGHASSYDNFQKLINGWEILTLEDVNQNNSIYSSEIEDPSPGTPFLRDREDKKFILTENEEFFNDLKNSPALEWPYPKLVCSAIFFVFEMNLVRDGAINFNIWFTLFRSLVLLNSQIRAEVCALIERNGFFKLNPQLAIDGAKNYFAFQNRTLLFFNFVNDQNDQEEILVSIFKLLQINEKDSNLLLHETLSTQNFSKIIEF